MQTPAPPAPIACSTVVNSSVNEVSLGPPAIRTGIGAAEATKEKDSGEPGQGTLTTW
ncbi:uncharacterized protein METZ01_LOCUS430990, partial [marine metagenome]